MLITAICTATLVALTSLPIPSPGDLARQEPAILAQAKVRPMYRNSDADERDLDDPGPRWQRPSVSGTKGTRGSGYTPPRIERRRQPDSQAAGRGAARPGRPRRRE